jgi:hypothetical protein
MREVGEGQGSWQLFDQMRTWPEDDRWHTHIDAYLTENDVAANEKTKVRTMIDDFKNWCLNPDHRHHQVRDT